MDLCRLASVMERKVLVFPERAMPVDDVVAFSNDETTYTNPSISQPYRQP